jgi:hypothetical protein
MGGSSWSAFASYAGNRTPSGRRERRLEGDKSQLDRIRSGLALVCGFDGARQHHDELSAQRARYADLRRDTDTWTALTTRVDWLVGRDHLEKVLPSPACVDTASSSTHSTRCQPRGLRPPQRQGQPAGAAPWREHFACAVIRILGGGSYGCAFRSPTAATSGPLPGKGARTTSVG